MVARDGFVYLMQGALTDHVQVFDVRDPSNNNITMTTWVPHYSGTGSGYDMIIFDDKLYMLSGGASFEVYDLATPGSPSLLGGFSGDDSVNVGKRIGPLANKEILAFSTHQNIYMMDVEDFSDMEVYRKDNWEEEGKGVADFVTAGNY